MLSRDREADTGGRGRDVRCFRLINDQPGEDNFSRCCSIHLDDANDAYREDEDVPC